MRRAPVLAALLALAAAGCAAHSAVTWRSGADVAPLAPEVPLALFVRTSAPRPLREALLARGAEEVAAFPEGERIAEVAVQDSLWRSWDGILADVERHARELGADTVLGTGAVHDATAEGVLWFQLLRSERRTAD